MRPHLLFLTLKVFSDTGGIEKVSRIAGKALEEICAAQGMGFALYSAYDRDSDLDPRYVPAQCFRGFGQNRRVFAWQSVRQGCSASVVVLSHVNLLPVGYAIKLLSPKTKLVLQAHGVEVWRRLPGWKRRMLQACDLVLPVSAFTRQQMVLLHGLDEARLQVVNNCLDPFLPAPDPDGRRPDLLERHGLRQEHKILFTLSRLSFRERYKGYDEVFLALKALRREEPLLRYLIVGRYDAQEKTRLDRMVQQQGLEDAVVFAGYVPDAELAAYFNLADVYVMPSRKEGFGIVFIEALHYGKPVIGGNQDGTVDALAQGRFGLLVDPDRPKELRAAIRTVLDDPKRYTPDPQEVRRQFGFDAYRKTLEAVFGKLLPDKGTVVPLYQTEVVE